MSELESAIAEVDAAEAAAARIEAEKFARASAAANAEQVVAKENAGAPDAAEKLAIARELAGTPVWFAQNILGLPLYPWQVEVLTWFEDTTELVKGSLCTPNGAGKSAFIVAALALWWISVHPQGMVVITTKDSKQLDNQIWPAIERHKGKFGSYDFIERMVRNGQGGFIIGFTTDDPGRAEGWHKIDDFNGPLLIIGDEAKSILDSIHMALDRCTYNAKLLTSSPGLTEGLFWRSNTDPAMGFLRRKVKLEECPHVPKSRIKNIIETYGADHWFTRSTLYAEFTDVDSETLFIIPKHVVRSAMDNPPVYEHGGQRAFCDFAAGRAENVFALKRGNRVTMVCWKDPDPMRAVARFVQLFVEHGLMPSEISGDAGGMGIAIIARFRELGWPINPVNNEGPAVDSTRYPNRAAEDWHEGAVAIARGEYIIPNDEILFTQLTSRRAVPTSDGILGAESKKEMAKRGVASPDRADAVLGVIRDVSAASTLFDEDGMRELESKARSTRAEQGSLDLSGEQTAYQAGAENPWLSVYERPIVHRRYLVVLNPVRHSEVLESHSLMVLRGPYQDEGRTVPAKLVAKANKPLRVDARPICQMIKALSDWYGHCMVVPISAARTDDRADIIDHLRAMGVHMYARRNQEVIGHGIRERLRFGWETTDYTRSQWIGAAAEAIRAREVEILDAETVTQLFQLTDGNYLRMKDAEAFGVGMKLIDYASTYEPPATTFPWSGSRQTDRRAIVNDSMIS
jgi:phage terminase large subunit